MDSSVYWHGPEKPHVEPLRTSVSTEVVVVGGGIAGLTCAQVLAERGLDVTLVERAFCGAGASGKSSGFITPDSELELSDLIGNYGQSRGVHRFRLRLLGESCSKRLGEFQRAFHRRLIVGRPLP